MAGEAETFESLDAKLFGEHALAVFTAKDPFLDARLDALAPGRGVVIGACGRRGVAARGNKAGLPRQEDFAGAQQVQLVGEAFLGTVAGKFGCAKLARGDIHVRQADGRAV